MDLRALWSQQQSRATSRRQLVEELRPVYAGLLARGTEPFFEPKLVACPLCKSDQVESLFTMPDVYQFKPGRFAIDECAACGHVFQNPPLSVEGLAFYYRDFYDGLGGALSESFFGSVDDWYRARARSVEGMVKPRTWLDVGGSGGQFCKVARVVFPDARFDLLDFSASADAAVRTGHVDRAYRGLLLELAPRIAEERGAYDVVSMGHYLEHTRDPVAEVRAAASLVAPGGVLLVELPDPDSRLQRALGRLGVNWLQPQHLHLLTATNLESIARGAGLRVERTLRGEAHLPHDFTYALILAVRILAKPYDVPWRAARSAPSRAFARAVLLLALPLLPLARLLDAGIAPALRRPGLANCFRVVARRPQ